MTVGEFYSRKSNAYISLGSLSRHLRCGWISSDGFITNSLVMTMKELQESVSIWHSYRQSHGGRFL